MSLTLYALADRYVQLQEMLAAGEIDEQTFTDTMASVEGDITVKADNCAAVMRALELEADAFRFEEQRLAERRKAIEANRERLRRYVEFELKNANIDKVRGARFYLTLQMNPPKVVVSDEEKIPDDFWRESDPVLDKKALLEALKAGTDVPGASMVQEKSLRVK